jgi:hypothetical protein
MNLAIGQGLENKIKYKRYTNTVYMFLLYNLLCCVKAQKCVVALCSFKNIMPNDLIICLPEKAYENEDSLSGQKWEKKPCKCINGQKWEHSEAKKWTK